MADGKKRTWQANDILDSDETSALIQERDIYPMPS